jgi:hypothetical protein
MKLYVPLSILCIPARVASISDHLSCICIDAVSRDMCRELWMQVRLVCSQRLYLMLCACAALHPGQGDCLIGGMAVLVGAEVGASAFFPLMLWWHYHHLIYFPLELGREHQYDSLILVTVDVEVLVNVFL